MNPSAATEICFSSVFRKFLCLGNPLMCLGEKMSQTLKKANNQLDKDSISNGELFAIPICLISDGPEYKHDPVAHESLCFFFKDLVLNSETDASGSTTSTLKRSFSLLDSTAQGESSVGSAIPVHQIISLVSMTSPRTFRPHKVSTSPAFVEFNTSESGYG